jgi:hypothetical protein
MRRLAPAAPARCRSTLPARQVRRTLRAPAQGPLLPGTLPAWLLIGPVCACALTCVQVSPPKTDIENNVIISDYAQMDRILKAGTRFYVSFLCVCVCVAGRSLGGLFGGGSLAG